MDKQNLFSIKFNNEGSRIIKYILKYSIEYKNIKNFTSDGFTRTKDLEKFELELKLDYGSYQFEYNNSIIYVDYSQDNNIVGTSEYPMKYEELIIYNELKENLIKFIDEARDFSVKPDKKNKLVIKVLKDCGWMTLSKIHKRPIETLFLDFDVNDLIEEINDFMKSENEYIDNGVPFKMNFLFEGLPGTGKTSLIYCLASYFDMDIASLNITKDLDDNTFIKAITSLPENTILVLEDIDALFVERESRTNLSFSALLNVLDGVLRKHKLITFLTTNHKNRLDNALVRSGRIDKEINFTYCKKSQSKKMYDYFFKDNEEDKKQFLSFINKLKFTTSDLHKFMFKHRKKDNIMCVIEDFVEEINKIKNDIDMWYI